MHRKENPKSSAFTIVELLVAVSIIVILIGILLAALGKARHNARTSMCLSNQRQIFIDMSKFSADRNGMVPWLTNGRDWFHEDLMLCPADENPVRLPGEALNMNHSVPVSYGFNPEYALYKIPADRVRDPSKRLVLYDGFNGRDTSQGGKKGGSGTSGGDYFINGNKVTVTHLPPGNNNNPVVASIALSALAAHVGHNNPDSTHVDLLGDWTINGSLDIPGYTQGDFVRRHPVGNTVGNAAFGDGHAISVEALNPTWYLYPN